MISTKTFGFTYEEYLEAVNILNFIIADWQGEDLSWGRY